MNAVQVQGGFQLALEASEHFCNAQKPASVEHFNMILQFKNEERINGIINHIRSSGDDGVKTAEAFQKYRQDLATYQNQIKAYPVVEATRLFGGGNIHDVYVLNLGSRPQWIVKPANSPQNTAQMCQAEHMASGINYHSQFRVPLTLNLEFQGFAGSAQLFVPNCVKLDIITTTNELNLIHGLDLQTTLIFDLITANTDRNEGNLLFQRVENVYRVYNIDHDQCLQSPMGRPLSLCYDTHPSFQNRFESDVAGLVSQTAQNRYEQEMRNHEADHEAITWMKFACGYIRTKMGSRSQAQIINYLKQQWNAKNEF